MLHTGCDGDVVPKPIVYTRMCRAAASSAATSGSTPWVLAPSVSTTIVSGWKSPTGGVGVAGVPAAGAVVVDWSSVPSSTPVGATAVLCSAMASIDARMAMPIAVPRDVVSLSMASISLC